MLKVDCPHCGSTRTVPCVGIYKCGHCKGEYRLSELVEVVTRSYDERSAFQNVGLPGEGLVRGAGSAIGSIGRTIGGLLTGWR